MPQFFYNSVNGSVGDEQHQAIADMDNKMLNESSSSKRNVLHAMDLITAEVTLHNIIRSHTNSFIFILSYFFHLSRHRVFWRTQCFSTVDTQIEPLHSHMIITAYRMHIL